MADSSSIDDDFFQLAVGAGELNCGGAPLGNCVGRNPTEPIPAACSGQLGRQLIASAFDVHWHPR